MKTGNDQRIIWEYDRVMETREWCTKIPFLKFPSRWQVQIIPPFSGASIRFVVKEKNVEISIYLDCYDNLGYFREPYWEIYPDKEGNNLRFEMNNTKDLIKAIQESLDEHNKNYKIEITEDIKLLKSEESKNK